MGTKNGRKTAELYNKRKFFLISKGVSENLEIKAEKKKLKR